MPKTYEDFITELEKQRMCELKLVCPKCLLDSVQVAMWSNWSTDYQNWESTTSEVMEQKAYCAMCDWSGDYPMWLHVTEDGKEATYEGTWGEGYCPPARLISAGHCGPYDTYSEVHPQTFFCKGNGYDANARNLIHELEVGETVCLDDPSGEHSVKRIT